MYVAHGEQMVHIRLQCSLDRRLNVCPTVARKLVFGVQEIGIECLQPEGKGSLQVGIWRKLLLTHFLLKGV